MIGVLAISLAGCAATQVDNPDATATPLPTPPNTVAAICDSARPSLGRLDRRFDANAVDAGTLVDQGAALAQITGIMASDVERLRSLGETGDDAEAWLDAMDAATELGVAAVRASASGDVDRFATAARGFEERWSASRALSTEIGYPSCPY